MKAKKALLIAIFLLALFSRFLIFKESTYFGFDEARDAYTGQGIYRDKDLRLIGPPANAPGLFHGPMYWYLLGPLYFLGQGNPYFVSAIFRLLNALGILVIFWLGQTYFNPLVGLVAAAIYAFSFEQNQYAMYVCHPSLAIFSWFAIFSGAAILLKKERKFWGIPLLLGGTASAIQFELLMINSLGVLAVLLFILKEKLKKVSLSSWLTGLGLFFFFLSTYLISEFKYNFRTLKSAFSLISKGYSVMPGGETRFSLYWKFFFQLVQDNILLLEHLCPIVLTIILLIFLISNLKKDKSILIILTWILGGIFLLPFGGYNAYYVNVGIGLGIIIGFSLLISKIISKNKFLGILLLAVVLGTNLFHTYREKKNSLIVNIKPQPSMKLIDEEKIIDKMYAYAQGKGFTIRAVNIPFKIPTVWAYLFENYALKKWGYLPYWETGYTLGFPGRLPVPKQGSTCVRFFLVEPPRGIPNDLINWNLVEENYFSVIVKEEKIGEFTLQTRQSKDKDCHSLKPI